MDSLIVTKSNKDVVYIITFNGYIVKIGGTYTGMTENATSGHIIVAHAKQEKKEHVLSLITIDGGTIYCTS